jgi:[protein-PII] uridylyltransferase
VATGGYGRSEMAFYSDVDVLFLIPHKVVEWIENIAEFILQALWDLGLKVGHSMRSPDECIQQAEKDLTIKTALLDARFIAGEKKLFEALQKSYRKKITSGHGLEFVEDKLAERNQRHKKLGNSRYVVEPNVKEGKGALRDLHTLFWLARFLYGVEDLAGLEKKKILRKNEVAVFRRAENFLWTVRQSIHLVAGRAEERLTFDMQLQLADALGYRDRPTLSKVERFMKHYYYTAKNVGDLTRIFCAVLEERHQKKGLLDWTPALLKTKVEGFQVEGGRLNALDEKDFIKNPAKMIKIFAVADRHGYDIHPDALRLISRNRNLIDNRLRRDPEANDAFLEILTSRKDPETGLRRMNEAGVLGQFITDFGRIVAHTQHDMYHSFTVDEHTIRAVGLLAKIEKGELDDIQKVSSLVGAAPSRRVLFMGIFLHDIAKGRGGDHSELGEKIAFALCPRLGFSSTEKDLVAWLVRDHLVMSRVAFKRDITDEKTIKDFVKAVKTFERLQLLALLTVADIMAVGPKIWNSWKDRLLCDLFRVAKPWFLQENQDKARETQNAEKQKALQTALKGIPAKDLKSVLKLFPENYWLGDPTGIQAADVKLLIRSSADKTAVKIATEPETDLARVTVVAQGGHELFCNLAGVLAAHKYSIIDARTFQLADGRQLNSFVFETGLSDPMQPGEKKKALIAAVKKVVKGADPGFKGPEKRGLLQQRSAYFPVEPRVRASNDLSADYTVIEVSTRDRIGLLYDLTKILVGHHCAIFSAHVATYGARAVDVFYLQTLEGKKIEDPDVLETLSQALMSVIAQKDGPKG